MKPEFSFEAASTKRRNPENSGSLADDGDVAAVVVVVVEGVVAAAAVVGVGDGGTVDGPTCEALRGGVTRGAEGWVFELLKKEKKNIFNRNKIMVADNKFIHPNTISNIVTFLLETN